MDKVWHLRRGIGRLHVSRKEKGRGLASIKDSMDTSIWEMDDYIKKSKESIITADSDSTDNIMKNRKLRNRNGKKKHLYWYSKWETDEISC